MAEGGSSYRSETFSQRHDYTPDTLLHMLVKVITYRHTLRDVRLVLRAGVDLDGDVSKGLRPLHYAAYENYPECIDLLVSYGADINVRNNNDYTPLHIAAKYGKEESVRCLLDNGAICNYVQSRHCKNLQARKLVSETIVNPMTLALENNHIEVVKILLDYGAYPNARYYLGYEISLIPPENVTCVELLAQNGANVDTFCKAGQTLLMRAAKFKNVDCVKTLIKLGADVNLQCPPNFDRKTALHFAVVSGNVETCTLLLDAGAKVTCPPNYPHSPLELALTQEHPSVVKLLLERGADPNELVRERLAPLQIACTFVASDKKYEMAEMLLEKGADPNYHNRQFLYLAPSLCPLVEYFSYSETYDICFVRLLLQYGANVSFAFPTRLLKIKEACGVLAQVHKLRPYEEILHLLISAAGKFQIDEIKKESSLSNWQRDILTEHCNVPRTLRFQSRKCIRDCLQTPVPFTVHDLPLPTFLKRYLLYEVP